MKLATLRTSTGTVAVRVDGEVVVELAGNDVGGVLAAPDWRRELEFVTGTVRKLNDIAPEEWAPVIPRPSKIVCVGLNYTKHITEMGRELPEYPTLFAKYAEALIGPYDPIVLPESAPDSVDWEGELAIVVGATARRATVKEAALAIGGYSIINDVTMRDFQYRTSEWFQGKTFEGTAPLGPYLVTTDEWQPGPRLTTTVDGIVKQSSPTDDLVFSPAELVSYVSQIFTLHPGDIIASGTPGGVGQARDPREFLRPGSTLTTEITGLGIQHNEIRRWPAAPDNKSEEPAISGG